MNPVEVTNPATIAGFFIFCMGRVDNNYPNLFLLLTPYFSINTSIISELYVFRFLTLDLSIALFVPYKEQIYKQLAKNSNINSEISQIIFIMLKIKLIRESKNITQDEMVAVTGIPKRSYVDYENEKQDISLDRLRKIATALNVTISELIGENPMLKSDIPEMVPANGIDLGIPLIPADAMAGFGEGDTQLMWYDAERYVVPEFSDLKVDFMIRVKGSSMYPKYSSGDLVACKKLPLTDVFFQWNKVYVLDTVQGPLIKRVDPGKDEGHILLISENDKYKPFQLRTDEVHAIAIVVGVIRFE